MPKALIDALHKDLCADIGAGVGEFSTVDGGMMFCGVHFAPNDPGHVQWVDDLNALRSAPGTLPKAQPRLWAVVDGVLYVGDADQELRIPAGRIDACGTRWGGIHGRG